VLAAHDDALAPAFAAIGKAKAAAAKAKLSAGDLIGFAGRAQERVFADLDGDGNVAVRARTRASPLVVGGVVPRAMTAYLDAIKPLVLLAKHRRVAKNEAKEGEASGLIYATSCGGFEKKAHETKSAIASCAFGLEAGD